MVSFIKRAMCPFCCTRFNVSEARYRCANPRCSGQAPDSIYAEYQGLPVASPMGPVFDSPNKGRFARFQDSRRADCPFCNRETSKQVCKVCHFELLSDAGATDERIIAVIGGRGVGKSNYIATLVHRLRNEFGQNFNAGVMARGETTRSRYDEIYATPLYRMNVVVPPTQRAATDPRIKTPMVFRVSFNQRRVQAVTLVLFDTAGEDMRSLDTMSIEAKYICFSDAIIFLLDPMQIDSVRQQLPPDKLPPRDVEADPIRLIERLRELHERQFGLGQKKIDKPLAFALSKIDELFPIIDPSSALMRSGEHLGYMNRADVETVNSEISAYLHAWIGSEFDRLCYTYYGDYHYFGVSALGKSPVNGRIEGVNSLRVEDPLVWILSRFKVIKEQ